ncbi:patatin-like phospholipase family protein [Methyloversatilis sp. XJ19-49]|uniref:patatin-like phospholipase family protein n=1 Tax=Methyloversatilis sp. XJ19-49 TaxID=2963429 RepID=UPI00211C1BF8|nr:patatin-like phospholipase family protein [Methyloversatilis sp. XJ19-49]MCQ9377050.1 patatin-like phospholipase family protein [Methyloversatilis sp. XJ19-49]
MGNRPTVSLVLGSGGARGLAHIGVIRELESRGYDIRAISGSSMGALVGGIHALGGLDAYENWVIALGQSDMLRLLDLTLSGGGLIRGDVLIQRLRELVGECNIEDLPLDYTAVAVDIERGREVWLSDGSLFEAIRASMAVPSVFTPHAYRGRLLVDGGLLNPVPVAPTLRTLTDLTVIVDLNGEAVMPPPLRIDTETDPGLLARLRSYLPGGNGNGAVKVAESGLAMSDVLMRSLETMQAALTRRNLAVFWPDVVINVPKNTCRFHEFHLASPLIEYGRRLAVDALDRLEASSGVRGRPPSP